jgi:hypothetical protein
MVKIWSIINRDEVDERDENLRQRLLVKTLRRYRF